MSRNFLILISIQATAAFFAVVTSFTISASLFHATGSAMVMALTVFFQVAPRIYLSFFGGLIVDRIDVLRTIRLSNWTEAAISIGTVVGLLAGAPITLIFWTFIVGKALVASVKSVALQASVKHLVDEGDYRRASGLTTGVQNFAVAAGPFAGLALFSYVGEEHLWLVFAMDTLVFLAAGLAVAGINGAETERALARLRFRDLRVGLAHIKQRPQLRLLVGFFAAQNFFNGICAGLIPFLLLSLQDGRPGYFAITNSAMSVAAVAGAFLAASLSLPKRQMVTIAGATLLAAIAGRLVVGLDHLPWLIATGLAFRSLILPFGSVVNQAIWLSDTPRQIVGRVLGTRRALAQGTYPIAVLIGGILAGPVVASNLNEVLFLFILCGMGEILSAGYLYWRSFRKDRIESVIADST
ncbi:MFS transporter [uncultured Ruegeria sp.]|uniref:MFS transporter n=1 Tax=uncultured Ruegeria sp. TaxID=259304 RepID=UPI0026035C5E|nr:MFS transporter [uncultured Ruegeria sp.]